MIEEKRLAERFDWELANAYMDRAEREGRTEDDGFWDYLETFGISRPEETDAFLKKIREKDRKSTERILGYLEEIRQIAREAQKKYARM